MSSEQNCGVCTLFTAREDQRPTSAIAREAGERGLGVTLDRINRAAFGDRSCHARRKVAFAITECASPNEFVLRR